MAESPDTAVINTITYEDLKIQVGRLVTAFGEFTSAINTLTSTVEATNTNIGNLRTAVDGFKTQSSADLTAFKTQLSTEVSNLKTQVSADLAVLKTQFSTDISNLKTQLSSKITALQTSSDAANLIYAEIVSKLGIIDSRLIIDELFSGEGNLPEDKNITYYLGSLYKHIVTTSQQANEEEEPPAEGDGESDSTEEAVAVTTAMREQSDDVAFGFTSYAFGASKQVRTMFLSDTDFASYKEGRSIDFTREFVCGYGTVDDTEVAEYVLLLADSGITTSSETGSTNVERVRSWKDVKTIQTFVVIKNTVDGSALLYFPTKDSFSAIDETLYNSEKKAVDAAVQKYQTDLADEHASMVVIPVASIQRGILQSEYFEQAKLITPMCEYN